MCLCPGTHQVGISRYYDLVALVLQGLVLGKKINEASKAIRAHRWIAVV